MSKGNNLHWMSIHYPMTYDEVKNVAERLGVALPEDYCMMIGPINGGALRSAFVEMPNGHKISYSRNVPLDKEAKANIFRLYTFGTELYEKYFPFGSVGNGDYFCFDLTKNNVVLWQHESNECANICETFSDLLMMIYEDK